MKGQTIRESRADYLISSKESRKIGKLSVKKKKGKAKTKKGKK